MVFFTTKILAAFQFEIVHTQDVAPDYYYPSDGTMPSKTKKALKTTNAYFYWVTREQGSFDWFKGVMNEVAELDQGVSDEKKKSE